MSESWAVYEDDDSDLLPLLVVRDSLGGSRFDERSLPSTGAGLLVDGMLRRDVAFLAAEWERWWVADTASSRPDVSHSLTSGVPSGPRLREFLDQHWNTVRGEVDRLRGRNRLGSSAGSHPHGTSEEPDPHGTSEGQEGDLTITHLVNGMESARGGAPHPFRLRLEILHCAEPGIWRVTRTRHLVSGCLRRDQAAFADAMAPILEDLGWGPI